MATLTEEQFNKIQTTFDTMGGMLTLHHEKSEFVGSVYNIKLKDNPLIEIEYHPINLTKNCIEMLKEVVGNNIGFNNTRTTFWINK